MAPTSRPSSQVTMKTWLFIALLVMAGSDLISQAPVSKEWIDADTGHRVVRLTGDAGGWTLYFHDNAFSPQGDKVMFNTPGGIAVVDVATIGTNRAKMEIVTSPGRGGYFSRRTREIYSNGSGTGSLNGSGRDSGTVTAVNIDTKRTREGPHARGLLNAHAN